MMDSRQTNRPLGPLCLIFNVRWTIIAC